jgi:hypothetical protein
MVGVPIVAAEYVNTTRQRARNNALLVRFQLVTLTRHTTLHIIIFSGSAAQRGPHLFTRFLDRTHRRATVGRTPLDK